MCKYVFTRGDKAGEACPVSGKDKFGGYCKRHYERVTKTKTKRMAKPNTIIKTNDKRHIVINKLFEKHNYNVNDNDNDNDNNNDNDNDNKNVNNFDPFPPLINKYQMKLIPDNELYDVEIEHDEEDDNNDFVKISTKNKKNDRLYEQYKEACEIKGDEALNYDEFDENEYLKNVAQELENINTPKFDEGFIKDCLFNLNLVAFTGLEQGSQILKEMYPEKELTDLTGLTRDVYEEEELYKKVLYDIYKENYEIIDLYLSPVTIYGLLSLKSIGVRYARNKKKA